MPSAHGDWSGRHAGPGLGNVTGQGRLCREEKDRRNHSRWSRGVRYFPGGAAVRLGRSPNAEAGRPSESVSETPSSGSRCDAATRRPTPFSRHWKSVTGPWWRFNAYATPAPRRKRLA